MPPESTPLQWAQAFEAAQKANVRRVQASIRRLFRRQVRLYLDAIRGTWQQAHTAARAVENAPLDIDPIVWRQTFDDVVEATAQEWTPIVQELHRSFVRAVADANRLLGIGFLGVSFDITQPLAVAYLREADDRRIRAIDDRTKTIIDNLTSTAVEQGQSYTQLARMIRAVGGFNNELFGRDIRGNDRALRVAIFETGDRYTNGQLLYIRQVSAESGLVFLKGWSTVRDNRVRPEHTANEGQGLIALDDGFISGNAPPTDPNCRCTLYYSTASQSTALFAQLQALNTEDES